MYSRTAYYFVLYFSKSLVNVLPYFHNLRNKKLKEKNAYEILKVPENFQN